jgi:hypothetical protein
VYQLVPDGMLERRVRAVKRDNHPSLEELGETRHVLRQQAGNNVGLFKIVGRAVDDQGYLAGDVKIELVLQVNIAILSYFCRYLGDLFFLQIKVDLEMLGGQNLPLEAGVLNFILPEIILRKSLGWEINQENRYEQKKIFSHLGLKVLNSQSLEALISLSLKDRIFAILPLTSSRCNIPKSPFLLFRR